MTRIARPVRLAAATGLVAAAVSALAACSPTPAAPSSSTSSTSAAPSGSAVAVVYFSQSGTTEAAAEQIADATGGTLLTLQPAEAYTGTANEIAERATRERADGPLPDLREQPDVSRYRTVLIGGPVWSGQVAAPVAAFLADADLSAAAVAPFWTDTGSPRGYEADFRALADGAGDLLPGLGLSGDESITEPAGQQWIQQVTQAPTPTAAASGGTSSARTVTVKSSETSAVLTLNDSAAADEFLQRLPLTVQAREMFDYEYYGPLPEPLTVDGPLETATEAGQVGFWTPGDQFVIYYDTPTRQPDGLLLIGTVIDGLDRLADLGPTAELRISR